MTERVVPESDSLSTPLWKWAVIGIIAVVIVALIAVLPTLGPATNSFDGAQQFRSLSAHFLLEYPNGWHKLRGKELDSFEGFSFVARHDKMNALLSVRIEDKSLNGISLKELETKLDETIMQTSSEFIKHSANTVKLESGEPALKYDYSAEVANGKAVRRVALIVPDKERVYFLSAWVEEADYRRARDDIDQALATFRLN